MTSLWSEVAPSVNKVSAKESEHRDHSFTPLLELPLEERQRLLRLLEESLSEDETKSEPEVTGEPSPAARWLLSMAGRYSGGPGNTAGRADEILRAEVDDSRGFTTN